jgi:hypothetical protein
MQLYAIEDCWRALFRALLAAGLRLPSERRGWS